jgi:hypothetical protein
VEADFPLTINFLSLHCLLYRGKGPSARARHVADMYDDRFLVVFGGETRSKVSNDLYALDFDNVLFLVLPCRLFLALSAQYTFLQLFMNTCLFWYVCEHILRSCSYNTISSLGPNFLALGG